ncbi:MAG: hypothetical protein RI953_2207 [Pseudomonadota bacterium]|jgi:hypothetical protein
MRGTRSSERSHSVLQLIRASKKHAGKIKFQVPKINVFYEIRLRSLVLMN